MVYIALVAFGLILGSFVNALVWRVHEQAAEQGKKKPSQKRLKELSVAQGRSMCPHCKHELRAADLVPVFSWLALRGKCRYCRKPISAQYPLVELTTAALFVLSYAAWPHSLLLSHSNACPGPTLFHGASAAADLYFCLWLALLTGFMALVIYDLRWYLLPNRIVYPLGGLVAVMTALLVAGDTQHIHQLQNIVESVAIGGGIFYLLFQLSGGKWIGGGDVKLGWLIGLLVASPGKAAFYIFAASVLGSLVSLPLLLTRRLKRDSVIPFGPFLIIGGIMAVLWGGAILAWYQRIFI